MKNVFAKEMKTKFGVLGGAFLSLCVLASCAKKSELNNSTTSSAIGFTPIKLEMSLEAERPGTKSLKTEEYRNLDFKLANNDANGHFAVPTLDFSNGKNASFRSIGLFYAPDGATGKKFFSAELTWERRDDEENGQVRNRYVCKTAVNTIAQSAGVDEAALTSQTWYMANVTGAKLDATNKTLTIDPYTDGAAAGWGVQALGDIQLNAPMASSWIPVQIKKVTNYSGLMVTSDVRSRFAPQGVILRLDVVNGSTTDFDLKGASIFSNYLKGAASLSIAEDKLDAMNVSDGGELALEAQDSSTGVEPYLAFKSVERLSKRYSGLSSDDKVLLLWAMPGSIPAGARKGYITVNVDAEFVSDSGLEVYNSADKRADYVPEHQRISLFRHIPALSVTFAPNKPLLISGQTAFASAIIGGIEENKLFNLERLVFENVKTSGSSYSFRSNHPYVNWHTDRDEFWLDTPRQYSPEGQRTVLANFKPVSDPKDPYFRENNYSPLTSTATYYLPSKEQVLSFLPVDPITGEFVMPVAGATLDITTEVQEQDLNLRHGQSKDAKATAKFRFMGGDASKVGLLTENGKVTFGSTYSEPLNNVRAGHHVLNFNPTSRVGYALAFLRDGDPKSLVAYRYSWGMSPPVVDYVNNGSANPVTYKTWNPNRAIVSFLMVSMVHIGDKSSINSLDDVSIVANEDFWIPIAQKKALVTRLLLAGGHLRENAPKGSSRRTTDTQFSRSANYGSYLLTRDYVTLPDADSYYFVVDSQGWSLRKFEATESTTLGGAHTAVSNATSMVIHPFVGIDPNTTP